MRARSSTMRRPDELQSIIALRFSHRQSSAPVCQATMMKSLIDEKVTGRHGHSPPLLETCGNEERASQDRESRSLALSGSLRAHRRP